MAIATNPLQTFLWGDGGTIKTPEQVARDRMIADALLKQGADYSPVQSWTQGAARLADAISSVVHEQRADSEEQAGIANAKSLYGDKIAALLSGTTPEAGADASASPVAATANLAAASPGDPSYQNAIASIESAGSGGYGAVGPTNPKLGRPLGKYQVMEANLPAWSKEALGYAVTPDQFLANPQLQDAVFNHQFGKYVSQFGPEGAAQAWFAGPGGVGHGDRADTLGTTVNDYTKRFDDALGGPSPGVAEALSGSIAPAAAAQPEAAPAPTAPPASSLIPLLLQASADPWAQKEYGPVFNALLGEQIKRSDPSYALDNEYKRAQIAALQAKPTVTPAASIQEYNLAKAGGYTGTIIDFLDATKKASQPSYGQTPIVLTDPQDKIHMGQMSNAGGFLVDGKTYASLPDGWKVGTVSQSGSGGLSDQALDIIATQYLAGDKSAIQGFARNATMRSQIANAVAKKASDMGMDGKAIAAEISAYGGNVAAQRAAGTRAAQVGMAASEADQMADIALDASKAVPRGAFMPWNAAENIVRTGTSSPEMASFVTATTSLVNAYARAVSPLGAPTDAMRAHAEQMLNTAQSPEAYAAVIAQMKKEMEAALDAPAEISSTLKSSITGKAPAARAPIVTPPTAGDATSMPPPSYNGDPKLWQYLTPEQRKLWQ